MKNLDRQVAEALGVYYSENEGEVFAEIGGSIDPFAPSTNWAQGGPLIEKHEIVVQSYGPDFWKANIPGLESSVGKTYLTAAMKALVASKS